MDTSPRVSVLMSVYNGGRYLCQAIESILDQTFADFEFIIVDDDSTDDTWQVLQDYAASDSRVVLVQNQANVGLAESLNKGLGLARSEYIARMDADDVSLPERLAAQVAALQSQQADVCFCECHFVDEDTGREWMWAAAGWHLVRWRGLFANSYGLHPSVMFRKEAILALDAYDVSFARAQDYELWDRCAAHRLKFAYVPEPLLWYRALAQGISRQHLTEQEQYARQVSFRAMHRLLPDASGDELRGLRWLFLKREDEVDDGVIRAGLYRCRELITAFLQTCEPRHSRAVWNNVALSLVFRLRGMNSRSRWMALRTILPAIRNACSARCMIRVMRVLYGSIRKKRDANRR